MLVQADIRWILTGTPIQNNIQELVTLFKFIGVTIPNNVDAGEYEHEITAVYERYLMRRTQQSVGNLRGASELPPLTVDIRYVQMGYEEEDIVYRHAHHIYSDEHCKNERRQNKRARSQQHELDMDQNDIHFCRLLQAAVSPMLYVSSLLEKTEFPVEPNKAVVFRAHMLHQVDPTLARALERFDGRLLRSTRMDAIVKDIKEHHTNDPKVQALIFCNWTNEIDMYEDMLCDEGINVKVIDGRTTDRGDILGFFRKGSCTVLIIQIKCGAAGLNLQEASRVYLASPTWNPTMELQALARAYRIGQDRGVTVVRMFVKDTMEDHVVKLQLRKVEQIDERMGDNIASQHLFGNQYNQLREMYVNDHSEIQKRYKKRKVGARSEAEEAEPGSDAEGMEAGVAEEAEPGSDAEGMEAGVAEEAEPWSDAEGMEAGVAEEVEQESDAEGVEAGVAEEAEQGSDAEGVEAGVAEEAEPWSDAEGVEAGVAEEAEQGSDAEGVEAGVAGSWEGMYVEVSRSLEPQLEQWSRADQEMIEIMTRCRATAVSWQLMSKHMLARKSVS